MITADSASYKTRTHAYHSLNSVTLATAAGFTAKVTTLLLNYLIPEFSNIPLSLFNWLRVLCEVYKPLIDPLRSA